MVYGRIIRDKLFENKWEGSNSKVSLHGRNLNEKKEIQRERERMRDMRKARGN